MSQETQAWAKQQRTGDPVTRAVLVELSNWAKPTGIVEFLSLDMIAEAVEVSRRTVIRHIGKLETELGLIRRVERYREDGGRGANGFVLVGYEPPAAGRKRASSPVPPCHPPGDNLAQAPCQIDAEGGDAADTRLGDKIIPPSDPDGSDTPAGDEERAEDIPTKADRSRGKRIPDGWTPPVIADLSPQARACAQQWPAGAYETEAEAFVNYWASLPGKAARKTDWTMTWANRVVAVSAKVLRDAKAGVKHQAPERPEAETRPAEPVPEQALEGGLADGLRGALAKRLGNRAYRQWYADAALLVQGDQLTVVTRGTFAADYIAGNHSTDMLAAMRDAGLHATMIKTEPTGKRRGSNSQHRSE